MIPLNFLSTMQMLEEKHTEFDLISYLDDQIKWSEETFGPPNENHAGVIDHIRKELEEIEREPNDLEEWIDVVILALDGAWRSGHSSKEIVKMLDYKFNKNKKRKWPDWRTAEPGKAIQHIKEDSEFWNKTSEMIKNISRS